MLDGFLDFEFLCVGLGGGVPIVFQYANAQFVHVESVKKENPIDYRCNERWLQTDERAVSPIDAMGSC